MLDIKFSTNENTHRCDAVLEGKWIVFTCPQCQDYRRKMHQETGFLGQTINHVEALLGD